MTVPATTRRAGPFSGNGTTVNFPFTFRVFADADIQVVKTVAGVDTTQVLGTDYSVTLNADQTSSPGGAIVYTVAPAVGVTLNVIGNLAYDQQIDLPDGGAYRAQQVEDALDRLAIQVQQIQELTGRSLAYTAATGPGFGTLPDVATRANKFLVFNASGVAGVSAGTGADTGLRADLGNTSTGATFVGIDGGTLADYFKTKNLKVVTSFTAMRALDKTKFQFAFLAASVGGGFAYRYDSTDTTSADDGYLVIVATDGGRWKPITDEAVNAKLVGAIGDNATNDYTALNKVFSTGLRGYAIPQGRYKFATQLINDYRVTVPPFPAPGNLSARACIEGESISNTILAYSGAGYAINLYGSDNAGAGQGIHSLDLYKQFTIQDFALAKANSGIYMQNRAWWKMEDVYAQYLDTALELQSCFTAKIENSYFMFSNVGAKLTTNALGASNALTFDRCSFTGNSKQGVLGVAVGIANSFRGCTFETCGTQADLTTGGVIMNVGAYGVSGPLIFDGCYFESNKGLADISIDNTTAQPLDVIVNGCFFNRTSATDYTNHNINVTSSGGGRVRVHLRGNSFASLSAYVANAARPFWTGTTTLVEFIDEGGNSYNETTSIVNPFTTGRQVCGDVSSAGALLNGPGFITASRLGAGSYRLVASGSGFGKTTDFYSVVATSIDSGGTTFVRNVVKQNGTTFDVSTVNNALTPTDGAFTFNVMLRGGA